MPPPALLVSLPLSAAVGRRCRSCMLPVSRPSGCETWRRRAVWPTCATRYMGGQLTLSFASDLHSVCGRRAMPAGLLDGTVPGHGRDASYMAHSLRLLVEKGLDTGSMLAAAQTVIQAFSVTQYSRCTRFANCRGVGCPPMAAAAVKHQLLPAVSFSVASSTAAILRRRTVGALTRGRTAGAHGRFVVPPFGSSRRHPW